MTELIITPDYDKKTARFKGTIAGGESVKVTIVGAANWLSDGLRLRVVCGCARTVAMFPLKSEDGAVSSFEVEGEDLIAAPLELNTIQARLHTQGFAATTATFIVEDLEKNILYFQDSYELRGWVKRCGDEEPYDLTKFPGLIEEWARQIENLIVDAKEVDGGIEFTVCDGVSPAKTFIIRNGRDGQPGDPGRKGDDGKSLTFNDLTEAQKAELKGPKGDTGEGITDELKALPDKVAENAQAIETNRVAINTEENRAKDAEKELSTRIEKSKANAAAAMTAASKAQDTADKTVTEIATLVGDDPGDKRKSARQIAAEEVAKVVANAPADLDTLKEIADYIESDKTGAAQMVTQIDANAKAISAEVSRSKGAEAELAGRVTELEENPSVIVDDALTQDGENPVKSKGIWSAIWGTIAAPVASVYEWVIMELGKYAKTAEVPAAIAGKEIAPSQVVTSASDRTMTINATSGFRWIEEAAGTLKDVRLDGGVSSVFLFLKAEEIDYMHSSARYGTKSIEVSVENYETGEIRDFDISVANGTVSYTGPEGSAQNSLLNMVNAMPRYRFVDAAIVDGVLTIAPYTNAKLTSDGTAFTVAVGGESGYMRDCVLVVDCGETAPNVIFDATVFFPRGGDAANLEVVAGKRNVFFITEVQPNQFMVARDELELPDAGGGE